MTSEKQISKKSYDPWEHLVIDNFYDRTKFSKMQIELLKAFSVKMKGRDLLVMDDLSEFPDTLDCIKSAPVDQSYLSRFDRYRPHEKLVTRNQVIFCQGKFDYRIHDEKETKVLSAVTYVAPKNAMGTRLYNKDKTFSKDVEWVPNRMMLFCGETGITWHSYHSEENTIRITVNTFLEISP